MAVKYIFSFFYFQIYFLHLDTFTLRIRPQPLVKQPEREAHKHNDKHVHNETIDTICMLPHYGENPEFTEKLIPLEEKLVTEITKFVNDEDDKTIGDLCHRHLTKYLREYNEDTQSIENDTKGTFQESLSRTKVVIENPILTVKLLRRLTKTLMVEALEDCKSSTKIIDFLNGIFKSEGLKAPNSTELERAYNGIIASTFIYGLNITSGIRQPPFNETTAKLKYEDYIELANINLDFDQEGVMTYHWINAAFESIMEEIEFLDEDSIANLNIVVKRLGDVTGFTARDMRVHLRRKWETSWHEANHAHDRLCEGEYTITANSSAYSGELRCYYKLKHLSHLKVETLSKDPPLVQIHDFLTDSEIEFIRNKSPVPLLRPWVYKHRKSFESEKEYAKAYLVRMMELVDRNLRNPRVVRLIKKIEATTNLIVRGSTAGAFEIGLYTPLSQFENVEKIRGTYLAYDPENKNKFASFLMFLTDVRMGGYTTFPDLNVFVRPEKGSAVFFYNYKSNIVEDPRVFHESCPVVLGMKEVANVPLFPAEAARFL